MLQQEQNRTSWKGVVSDSTTTIKQDAGRDKVAARI